MRVATYGVPAKGSEEADLGAECAVSFFGTGQGGSVEMNFQRWVGQFEQPVSPVRSSIEAGGMQVDIIRISGTYLSPGGMMMQSQRKEANYRMMGAVVQAPEGVVERSPRFTLKPW